MSEKKSLLATMANKYEMEPAAFANTLKATVMPGNVSNEQFAGFLMVAKEYDLNPLTKEIYAFPSKGGIQPIVSIDGWMKMINSHPDFDGLEFSDILDNGKLVAITARMYRKDRAHPVEVTEYMSECRRETPTWKQWPARMLRHKAAIQAARYAFGFSGIYDPDEAARMQQGSIKAEVVQDQGKGVAGMKARLVQQEEEVIDVETGEIMQEVENVEDQQ